MSRVGEVYTGKCPGVGEVYTGNVTGRRSVQRINVGGTGSINFRFPGGQSLLQILHDWRIRVDEIVALSRIGNHVKEEIGASITDIFSTTPARRLLLSNAKAQTPEELPFHRQLIPS